MLSAVFSLYSTMLDFLAAAPENSVGFSDKIKHTQATDIKFGDTFRTISPVFSERLLNQVNQEIDDDNIYFRSDFVKGFLEGREVSSVSIDIKTSKIFDRLELHNNSENPMFLAKLCPGKPTIQFDKNGHLMNKEGFQKTFLTTSSDALRTLCSDALEKMADELQWRGRSVKVRNISLMRYP
ncbi:hypothetical protein [Endozoicomonas sp. YOMI1]|uniref:hypothetical protein n=1 Tax=Endozoicomonas sp. YOMI1 TaxID=2828739 RepID=UPI002148547F|nr:hypothetical protein [Endozoicomonas sp. YOMI1]